MGSNYESCAVQRILMVQLRQLGDILLTTPCIRELKAFYPDAEIDFLSHKMGKHILQDNPDLFQLLTYGEDDGIYAQLTLIRKLRQRKYDLVMDFMYNPRSALLSALSGAKKRLAFPSRRSFAYNEIVSQPSDSQYIVQEKFAYLRHVGASPQDESLVLPWFQKHMGPYLQAKDTFFADTKQMRVVLSPTHRRKVRQWPVERYAKLADVLTRDWGAKVMWIWGPGEEEFVKQVQGLCQEESNLSPKTSLRELAALLANCDLFIGNSNGPSHIAVSTGIPSLQLHGPTIAQAWCPMTAIHGSIQKGSMGAISLGDVHQGLENLVPALKKRLEARQTFGDRIWWQQGWDAKQQESPL